MTNPRSDEMLRLEALRQYQLLDTPPDGAFDRVTALAARHFRTPICLVSLLDEDRIWFKSRYGLDAEEIPRTPGLCGSATFAEDAYVVRDAVTDPRTLTNPLVTGALGLRFYAAAPLVTHDGFRLGTFNVIDFAPREFGPNDTEALKQFAGIVVDQMELRLAALKLARSLSSAAASAARRYDEAERERARFATVFMRMGQAVCQLDRDARFEHVNPAAETILGARESELRGQDFHGVVHRSLDGLLCDSSDCDLSKRLLRLDGYRGDEVFATAAGNTMHVRVACTPILVAGQAVGAIVSFDDITAQQETNLRKDNFLAFAAHELRSPLTPIVGASRWLNREVKKNDGGYSQDFLDIVDTLGTESERLSNIIEVFLDLSRIESNRLTMEPDPCDICEVIARACNHLRSSNSEATVEIDLPVDSYRVFTDEARLSQVLTNLLENAVKYGGDPPQITVSLRIQESTFRIGVRDRGAGIPEEDQPRIFERFFRSSSVTGKKGFGVGLYLAREIISQLGGQLTFTSRPGEGTEFFIDIPVADAES